MSNEFSKHLQDCLRDKGLTKAQLAKLTGYSKTHIGRLVSGEQMPSAQMVRDIALHIDIPVERLQAIADAARLGQERLARAAGLKAEAVTSNALGVWLPIKTVAVDGYPIAEFFSQTGFPQELLQKLHVRNDLVGKLLLGLPISHECFMVLEPDGSRRYLSPSDVAANTKLAAGPASTEAMEMPKRKVAAKKKPPSAPSTEPSRASSPLPPMIVPEDVTEPPEEWELEIIEKIGAYDWGDLDPRRMGEFWYMDRVSRRRVLRHLEDIWLDFGRDRMPGQKGDAAAEI